MKIKNININNEAVLYTGTITEITDTGVTIQLTARLGVLKLPWRQIISNRHPEIGDKIKFKMSYIELQNDIEI